jgi:hypothetical protein
MQYRIQIDDGVYELQDGKWVCIGSIWTLYPHGNCLRLYDHIPPPEKHFSYR